MRTSSKLSTNREWTTTAFIVGARSLFSCSFRLRETGGEEEGRKGREEERRGGREGRRGGREGKKEGKGEREEEGWSGERQKGGSRGMRGKGSEVWSGKKENREGQ